MEALQGLQRIVSFSGEKLELQKKIARKLKSLEREDLPVIFLAVLGPPMSGKYSFTNLLINYFKTKHSVNSSVKPSACIQDLKSEPSGVFIYPEAFRQNDYDGEYILFILHLHLQSECSFQQNVFECFLHTICSRIITIIPDETEVRKSHCFLDFLEATDYNTQHQRKLQKTLMCIYITTSPFLLLTSVDIELIKGQLLHIKSGADYKASWVDRYKSVSVAYVSSTLSDIIDNTLVERIDKDLCIQLDQVVRLMGDCNQIFRNTTSQGGPQTRNVHKYLEKCLIHTNQQQACSLGSLTKATADYMGFPHQFPKATTVSQQQQSPTIFRNEKSKGGVQISFKQEIQESLEKCMAAKYQALDWANLHKPTEISIASLLSQSTTDVVQIFTEKNKVASADISQRRKAIKTHCKSLESYFSLNHIKIFEFHAQASDLIRNHLYSVDGQWETQLQKIKASVFGQVLPETLNSFLDIVYENLKIRYKENLVRINNYEHALAQHYSTYFNQLYVECMSHITSLGYYSPKHLYMFHLSIVEKLTMAAEFCHSKSMTAFRVYQELPNNFYNHFKRFRTENGMKLATKHNDVTKLISKQQKAYCKIMENILKEPIDLESLRVRHEAVLQTAKLQLAEDIQHELGENEATELYLAILDAHVQKYWVNYQASHITIQNEKGTIMPAAATFSEIQQTHSTVVFKLTMKNIQAAVVQKGEIMYLESMAALVGVTHMNEWLCGDEVRSLSSESKSIFKKVWKLEDCLFKSKADQDTITIGNINVNITTVFLLSLLFHTAKKNQQKELNISMAECIVTIPFWFTAFHRQQVIDAGKIAGFTKTEIINENSAIALAAAENTRGSPEILVLTETALLLDATVYIYDQFSNLKIIGHSTDVLESRNDNLIPKIVEVSARAIKQNQSRSSSLFGSLGKKSLKNKNIKDRTISICFESESLIQRLPAIKQALPENIGGNVEVSRTDIAIFGAYIQKVNGRGIKEWISSDIHYNVKSKMHSCFQKQVSGHIPFGVSVPSSKKAEDICLYQSIYNMKSYEWVQIGVVKFSRGVKNSNASLHIDHHGIVTLGSAGSPPIFQWIPIRLDDQQLYKYSTALQNIETQRNIQIHEAKLKNDLVDKWKMLQSRVQSGEVRFQTKLGRKMALQQIEDAMKRLQNPIKSSRLNSELSAYESSRNTYFPKG